MAQYEKKQKELKNLCVEESQLKRAHAMKLDKEHKQNIRRQKKREMKEQHVQEVLGYNFNIFACRNHTSNCYVHVFGSETIEMFSRECNQIHQKREEMADKIQEISGETQQLKAKMKNLRDVCSKETEKAQVSDQNAPHCERLPRSWLTCVCMQALYDTLSTSMEELHRRIEVHIAELKLNATNISADF